QEPGQHARPRIRRERLEMLAGHGVDDAHAEGPEDIDRAREDVPDQDGFDGLALCTREATGQGQHLERGVGRRSLLVLDQREDHAGTTPRPRRTSTIAPAASGPVPRTRTSVGRSGGSISRTFVIPPSLLTGRMRSIGFCFARTRPGSEGYRGRLRPSLTVSTAGRSTSNTSRLGPASRSAIARPSTTSRPFTPVTHGRSSACATRRPT